MTPQQQFVKINSNGKFTTTRTAERTKYDCDLFEMTRFRRSRSMDEMVVFGGAKMAVAVFVSRKEAARLLKTFRAKRALS